MLSNGGVEHRLPYKIASPLKNGLVPGSADMSTNEEVRTLFVSGLPMDVRLRELYLLFRCYEGYEGSFLKLISSKPGKPPQPIAFVSFTSRSLAERALEELQGVRFDPASSQTLRLEFARTNSRVSPKQQQAQAVQQSHVVQPPQVVVPPQPTPPVYFQPYTTGVSKDGLSLAMAQASGQAQHSLFGMTDNSGWSHRMLPMNYHQNLSHVSTPSPTLSPAPSTPHLSVLNILSDSDSSLYNSPSHTPTQALDTANYCYYSMGNSPVALDYPSTEYLVPSSTLFVGNLDPTVTDVELSDLFSSYEGFVKVKLVSRGGAPPVAFVEYKDVDCADQAMGSLQGHLMSSSNRLGGIRIEYARQRHHEPTVKSPPGDVTDDPAIQSITTSAAALSLGGHKQGGAPVINSSSLPEPGPPAIVESIPSHPPFHLDLQPGQQQMAIPKPDYMGQQAPLPAFPVHQGLDPNAHSFSLPRQSPVQNISSLVTQNLSASATSPHRMDFNTLPQPGGRLMFGPQGYAGMSRYSPQMMAPGSIGINQQGQVFVNGYVQGVPQNWAYSKPNYQPSM